LYEGVLLQHGPTTFYYLVFTKNSWAGNFSLRRMGPIAAAFLYKIAETVPFHFPPGKGAAKVDLPVAEANYFPVTPPGAAFNIHLLTDLQGIWPEN
jgi:hypothetical protein